MAQPRLKPKSLLLPMDIRDELESHANERNVSQSAIVVLAPKAWFGHEKLEYLTHLPGNRPIIITANAGTTRDIEN